MNEYTSIFIDIVMRANKHMNSYTIVSFLSLNFYGVRIKRVFEMLSLTEIKQQVLSMCSELLKT